MCFKKEFTRGVKCQIDLVISGQPKETNTSLGGKDRYDRCTVRWDVQLRTHQPRTRRQWPRNILCSVLAILMPARTVRNGVVFRASKEVVMGLGEGGGWEAEKDGGRRVIVFYIL